MEEPLGLKAEISQLRAAAAQLTAEKTATVAKLKQRASKYMYMYTCIYVYMYIYVCMYREFCGCLTKGGGVALRSAVKCQYFL